MGRESAVRVLVRCRPLLPHESSGVTATLRLDRAASTISMCVPNSPNETRFRFDGVADVTCTQDDVYELGRVSELVESTVAGYHATIFAYGQTASGKTFTMEGYEYGRDRSNKPVANLRTDPRKLGVIPRAVDELFARVAAAGAAGGHVRVRMSYFQLYKEQIFDLLSMSMPADRVAASGSSVGGGRGRRGLRLRWAAGREFYVENLSEYEVGSAEEALELFRLGVAHKAMAETHSNAASSRSHCVVQLHVDGLDGAHGNATQTGTLSLVDLAGSERQPKGTERSANLVDSVEINRSLFALRKVIVALSEGARKHPHVPYRDAVLTKVLKGSLGGSARTLMVACISCADEAAEESLSTLAYAARARTITNSPVLNAEPKLAEIRALREQLAALRQEVARLTALLGASAGAGAGESAGAGAAIDDGGVAGALCGSGGLGAGAGQGQRPQAAQCGVRGSCGTQSGAAAASARPGSAAGEGAGGGAGSAGVDPAVHRRLGERFVESVAALKAALLSEGRLRETIETVSAQAQRAQAAHAQLAAEHEGMAERLRMLETVVRMESYPDARWLQHAGAGGGGGAGFALQQTGDGAAGAGSADALDASTGGEQSLLPMLKAALQEAIVLRAENEQLRDWLQATPSLAAPPRTPGTTLGARTERGSQPAAGAPAPRSAGSGAPAVHRLSSSGRLVAQHGLLLASEQLSALPPAELHGALASSSLAQRPHTSAGLEAPPPADTFTNLEQLAVLLRQRAALSRHTQVIASLSKQRGGASPAAAGEPPPQSVLGSSGISGESTVQAGVVAARRTVSAGPATAAARTLLKQQRSSMGRGRQTSPYLAGAAGGR